MSASNSVGRAVALGGRGAAWAFLIPVMVVAIYVIDSLAPWPAGRAGIDETAANVSIALLCVGLWYFVLGRLPNHVAVKNVRHQTSTALVTIGVDVFTRPRGSARLSARFPGSVPSIVAVSSSGLQLWAGSGDSARPVSTIHWSRVGEVSAVGGRWTSLIAVQTSGSSLPFVFSFLENRFFATLRARGQARARLVAQLEGLRRAAMLFPPGKTL